MNVATSSAGARPNARRLRARRPQPVLIALPDGRQRELPGALWQDLASTSAPAGSSGRSIVSVDAVENDVANDLYEEWGHDLGACRRPFRVESFVMRVRGADVAAASSASTVSRRVTDTLHRKNCVELARLARSPEHPHALRALLRIWRLYLAPGYPCWPIDGAIAYAMPGKKDGELYRFDGWRRIRVCRRSGGGGSWSRPSAVNRIGDGKKTLWTYEFRTPQRLPPAHDGVEQLLLL